MDLIETFGAKIGALSEEKPQRARQLLTAGFRANGVKNKLASKRSSKSDRMLFQLVNRAMVTCLAKPQSNVMVSLFTPCEMLHLQGLHPYSCEGFSSYLSGAMAEQPFLHQAEDTGIPNSLCSYHKVFIGAAQMGLMPKPRFILSTSLACDANTLTFRHLAQFYDVPHFNVDIPFESSPQAVDYVAGQLRQMGEFLTRQTGLPLDDGQLARTVARSQRTMALYHRGPPPPGGAAGAQRPDQRAAPHRRLPLPPGHPGDRGLRPAAAPGDHHRSPRPGQAAALDSHHPLLGGPPAAPVRPEHPGPGGRLRHEL